MQPRAIAKNKIASVPKQVDPEHLRENGKLVSDTDLRAIQKRFADNPNLKRYKFKFKDRNGKSFPAVTILRFTNDNGQSGLYAVYQGEKQNKLLGKGGIGKVKLMQDLQNGEWGVLKVMSTNKIELADFEKEMKNLQAIGGSPGGFKYNGKRDDVYLLGMKLIHGRDIRKQITESEGKSNIAERIHIAHGMVDAIQKLNQTLIHRDIKPENFHYDPKTGVVEVIDMGSAVLKSSPRASSGEQMSSNYIPPEVIKHVALVNTESPPNYSKFKPQDYPTDTARKKAFETAKRAYYEKTGNFDFSMNTDTYALGLAIGEVLGLAREANTKDVFDLRDNTNVKYDKFYIAEDARFGKCLCIKNNEEAKQDPIITDENTRNKIIGILKEMTAEDPAQRPSLDKVLALFAELKLNFPLQTKNTEQKYALIDLGNYEKLTEQNKTMLITSLKNEDKKVIVINDAKMPPADQLRMIRDLEGRGLDVHPDNFSINDKKISRADVIKRVATQMGVASTAIDYPIKLFNSQEALLARNNAIRECVLKSPALLEMRGNANADKKQLHVIDHEARAAIAVIQKEFQSGGVKAEADIKAFQQICLRTGELIPVLVASAVNPAFKKDLLQSLHSENSQILIAKLVAMENVLVNKEQASGLNANETKLLNALSQAIKNGLDPVNRINNQIQVLEQRKQSLAADAKMGYQVGGQVSALKEQQYELMLEKNRVQMYQEGAVSGLKAEQPKQAQSLRAGSRNLSDKMANLGRAVKSAFTKTQVAPAAVKATALAHKEPEMSESKNNDTPRMRR